MELFSLCHSFKILQNDGYIVSDFKKLSATQTAVWGCRPIYEEWRNELSAQNDNDSQEKQWKLNRDNVYHVHHINVVY